MKRFISMSIFVMFASVIFSQPVDYLHLNKVISRMEVNQLATGVWFAALHPSAAMALMEAKDLWPLNTQGDLMAAIQIETPEGVANIKKILKVPGIGGSLV